MQWVLYATLSAFFASLVAIFGKIGIKGVDSNLAVAIRTVIIVIFAWAIIGMQGNAADIFKISRYSYTFIILSAIATGLSWLFYYKLSVALTVILAFMFLGEKPTLGNISGAVLVTLGVLATVFIK
jgi:transporter family protein